MKDEEWYVILNMNCKYEICRMCPKSGLFKGSYEECEKWIERKKKEEMKEKSVLEMVGGEKHINPHYNIKIEKMSKEELEKLKETVDYFGHWYDVIGEERVSILEKSIEYIVELEKENAELKNECRTCVYTDSPCVLSDYPSKNGICSHYKNVFEENAELKEQNSHLYNDLTITEAENAELKNVERMALYSKLSDQLTKAKKLIKGMNEYLSTKPEFWSREEQLEIVELSEKADQFLKDIKE